MTALFISAIGAVNRQWGRRVNAKKALEKAGFPTLILNGDGADQSNTSDGQVLTRLDAFIEMLEDMKK